MAQQIYTPPTAQDLIADAKNIFGDAEHEQWLRTRNEYLGGQKPVDLIQSDGEDRERVRDLLESIKLGIPT